jgi:hypothetical protein
MKPLFVLWLSPEVFWTAENYLEVPGLAIVVVKATWASDLHHWY